MTAPTPSHSKPKPDYLYTLDILRFSCALLVLFFHLGYSTWQDRSGASDIVNGMYTIPEGTVFWFGWIGVQLFFVISGYVIANSSQSATPYAFIRSRLHRLLPAAWVCASFSLIVAITFDTRPLQDLVIRYINSIFLVPTGPWIEGVYWTLALEVFFYLIVFLFIACNAAPRILLFAKALSLFSATTILTAFILRVADLDYPFFWSFYEGLGKRVLLVHGVFFAIGIYLQQNQQNGTKLASPFFMLATTAAALQIYIGATNPSLPDSLFMLNGVMLRTPWLPLGTFFTFLLLIHSAPKLNKYYSYAAPSTLSMLRTLGLSTYPLYLVHFTFGVVLISTLTSIGLSPFASFGISCFATIALSIFIATALEPVALRLLKALTSISDRHTTSINKLLSFSRQR